MTKLIRDLRQQAKIASGILARRVYTGPWTVQIDLTNRCNNNCIACWCNSPLLGDKQMDPKIKTATLPYELLIRIIDELAGLGVRGIYFTGGGEPFMHPRILDFMRRIKQKGIHLDMSTNFTLVDESIGEQLVKLRVDHLNISLWAGTREVFARQHPNRSEQTFDRMAEVIDFIVGLKEKHRQTIPGLGMYNVINCFNYDEIHRMVEFAFAHHMDEVHFTPVDTVPERTDELRLTAEHREHVIDQIRALPEAMRSWSEKYAHRLVINGLDIFARRIDSRNAGSADYDADLVSSLPSCYAGWSFARILATGEVNSCLKSFKIPVGSVYESSFRDIWLGSKQQEFRNHTIDYDAADPYFHSMGNDRATAVQGCYKCCDNIGMNLSIHEKMSKLGWGTRQLLRSARYW